MDDSGRQVKAYLAGLQAPPLPDGLWQRVAAARRRRMAARLGVAASCAGAVGVLTLVLFQASVLPGRQAAPPARVADAAPAATPAAAAEENIHRSVQAIDRALQVAYDRQATDDEVAPLWQARKELLSSIAATGKTAGQQG